MELMVYCLVNDCHEFVNCSFLYGEFGNVDHELVNYSFLYGEFGHVLGYLSIILVDMHNSLCEIFVQLWPTDI